MRDGERAVFVSWRRQGGGLTIRTGWTGWTCRTGRGGSRSVRRGCGGEIGSLAQQPFVAFGCEAWQSPCMVRGVRIVAPWAGHDVIQRRNNQRDLLFAKQVVPTYHDRRRGCSPVPAFRVVRREA